MTKQQPWSLRRSLRAAAAELPDQPVLIVTQIANQRSLKLATRLGFHQVNTFEEFGAEQTLGTRPPAFIQSLSPGDRGRGAQPPVPAGLAEQAPPLREPLVERLDGGAPVAEAAGCR